MNSCYKVISWRYSVCCGLPLQLLCVVSLTRLNCLVLGHFCRSEALTDDHTYSIMSGSFLCWIVPPRHNSTELHSLLLRWHGVKSICYYLFSGSLLSCISINETQHLCMSICTTFLQYPQLVDLWNPQATCSSDNTTGRRQECLLPPATHTCCLFECTFPDKSTGQSSKSFTNDL